MDSQPDGPRLRSWSHSAEWPAVRKMEARCRSLKSVLRPARSHEAPQPGHSCGIYAARDRADVEAMLRQLGEVGPTFHRLAAAIGRVSLWGRVIENTGGWRAQFAYPYDLVLFGGDEGLAAGLRRRYAVDVSLGSA